MLGLWAALQKGLECMLLVGALELQAWEDCAAAALSENLRHIPKYSAPPPPHEHAFAYHSLADLPLRSVCPHLNYKADMDQCKHGHRRGRQRLFLCLLYTHV